MDPELRHGNVLSGQAYGDVVQAGSITTLNMYSAPIPVIDKTPPCQLEPDVPTFVNQTSPLAAANSHLRGVARPGVTPVAVIMGGPGIGKTALATHWAHSVRADYPDGQLFLRFDADQRTPTDMVEGLVREALRSLHVASELLPARLSDLLALYRSVTEPLRLVIILDAASKDAEVKPLIPASPGSVVLVTTRHWLGELVADTAEPITLSPLEPGAAVQLLGLIAGSKRVEQEPTQATRLAELCGGLPVALRVAASRIAARRGRPLSDFVAALEDPDTRLGWLDAGSAHGMTHVFNEVARDFDSELRRAYALLGTHPGTSFDEWSAAALLDRSRAEARDLLDRLWDASMLEDDDGRFRFNSLIRTHAASLAAAELTGPERDAARDRLIEYYRIQAYRADWCALDNRLRLGSGEIDKESWPTLPGPTFQDAAAALDWLDAERGNILAAQALAAVAGHDAAVSNLAEALYALFASRNHVADAIEAYTNGIKAAERLRDGQAQAQISKQLAAVHRDMGELDRADALLDSARAALPEHGAERMTASLWEATGKIRLLRDLLPEAREAFERSRALNVEFGWDRGRLLQEVMLGVVLRREGKLAESLDTLTRAAAGLSAYDTRNQARAAVELAKTASALGRGELAVKEFLKAAALYAERAERVGEISALLGVADEAEGVGRPDLARAGLERVALLYADGGDEERAEQARDRLAALTGPTPTEDR
jgi:tetratricopeptide (TPR) repeat protein